MRPKLEQVLFLVFNNYRNGIQLDHWRRCRYGRYWQAEHKRLYDEVQGFDNDMAETFGEDLVQHWVKEDCRTNSAEDEKQDFQYGKEIHLWLKKNAMKTLDIETGMWRA